MIIFVVLAVIFFLVIMMLLWYIFFIKKCSEADCPLCDDTTIMKLEYDYPIGQAPQKAISDFSSDNKTVEKQIGSRWNFLWG